MSVIVAYSPSDQGRAALYAGASQARLLGAPLVVASHTYLHASIGRAAAEEAEVLAALDELAAPVTGDSGAGAEPAAPVVRVQDAADPEVGEFLLRVAGEHTADLIVIGLRARSRVGKLALGAAARRVVLGSPCPVLAVKHMDGPAGGGHGAPA
ncbi:universal stress protein [Brachybacterium huguangmaarense]